MEDTKKRIKYKAEEPEAGPSNLENANEQVWSFNKSHSQDRENIYGELTTSSVYIPTTFIQPQKLNSINSRFNHQVAPAWLGTHRHLQAAIAAIDDRLLFLRICEELEAKGNWKHF
jgi:hypothetical protein